MQYNRFLNPIAAAILSFVGLIGTLSPAFGQVAAPSAQTVEPVAPALLTNPITNSALDAETFYRVLLGELNVLDNEPRIGFALMLDSARKTLSADLFDRAVIIALQSRSGESALTAARAWLVAIPTSIDAARYLTQISVSMNRLDQTAGKTDIAIALEVAKNALAKNPNNAEAAQLALALMLAKETTAESLVKQYLSYAPANRDKALMPQPEIRLAYARTLISLTRVNDALLQVQKLSLDSPSYAPSWLVLGTLQYQMGQDAASKNNTHSAAAQISLNKFIELTNTLPVEQRSASQARAYTLIANIAKDNKQYQKAYDTLVKAIANSNESEHAELQYELAMVAEKLARLDDMERILRQVIDSKPDDPQAYNALGYALADRNMRLPEAKALIQKAVKLAPTDPYIADSLGWVEFKLGNFAEALRVLEAAYTVRQDAEIAAHLGEVLWQQGLKERATALWKEAMKINKNSDALLETLKRFGIKP